MNFASLEAVKERINKNYNCIKELEELIPLQNTEEEKLELITFIGKMYAEYVTGIYASNVLEQEIVKIGKEIDFIKTKTTLSNHVLIVMSGCGDVGGHTVLVHNWIKWDDEKKYSIVFTNKDGFLIPEFLKYAVLESGGEIRYLSGTYTEKANKLLELSQEFERVLLFTHMEDVIPVLAYSNPLWKIPVYFYNHADFKFSFGFSVSDIVLNLFEYDVKKTIRYRGIENKYSICFQFPGQGQIEKDRKVLKKDDNRMIVNLKYGLKEKEKLIVSMGEDFKYENIIGYQFDDFVREVLKQSHVESSFLIIGADKEKGKWIYLSKNTKGKGRGLGVLPRNEAEQLIAAADVYIASFPMEAYGRVEAENQGVPCLFLNMIDRYIDKNDIRVSKSVDELIEKTLDILNGNREKYIIQPNTGVWSRKEWKKRWEEIYSNIDEHELHVFQPRRYIEKQEYINCQLLQERAAKIIYDYMKICRLDEAVKKKILKIDYKYEMGIVYNHINFLEKKCDDLIRFSNKHLKLYKTVIKWIGIKQEEKRIDEYIFKQGYRTVAIYGMGYMGECLANELVGGLVEVLYGIDRNAEKISSKIAVYYPADVIEKVDVIINTTTIDNSKIQNYLSIKDVMMLRLDSLLDRISQELD